MEPAAHLLALSLEALTAELHSRTRATAVLRWLWSQATAPQALPARLEGVSQKEWARLKERVRWSLPTIHERAEGADGTTKYALQLEGAVVETVRIPARGRSTICISSQAGCTRKCQFCATQTLGFGRNLEVHELLGQYYLARLEAPPEAPARNVVFMGMGEPMDNLEVVLKAVEQLTQGPFPQLGAQQVTVSTSGVLPGMVRFLAESRASLALSLNATTDETRAAIMPHTRTWPIAALLDALRADAVAHPGRVHFIEYVLLAGVNDSDADADRLGALLEGVPARLNLIPHNPFPGNPLRPPSVERTLAFQQRVMAQGLLCLVRWPRGRDVAAACGQLVLAGQGFSPSATLPEAT